MTTQPPGADPASGSPDLGVPSEPVDPFDVAAVVALTAFVAAAALAGFFVSKAVGFACLSVACLVAVRVLRNDDEEAGWRELLLVLVRDLVRRELKR